MSRFSIPLKPALVAVVSATSIGALMLVIWALESVSSQLLKKQIEQTMAVIAEQVHERIDGVLAVRAQDLAMLAKQLEETSNESTPPILEAMVAAYPTFTWIGIVTADKRVLMSKGRDDDGRRVLNFIAGSDAPIQLIEPSHPNSPKEDTHLIALKAPIPVRNGQGPTYLLAALDWTWVEPIVQSLRAGSLAKATLEAIILHDDHHVLYGPPGVAESLVKAKTYFASRKSTGGTIVEGDGRDSGEMFLTGYSRSRNKHAKSDFETTVLVRQDTATALAPLGELKNKFILYLLLFGVHVIAFHLIMAEKFVSPIKNLAKYADKIRVSGSAEEPPETRITEVQDLIRSLNTLLVEVQSKEQALKDLTASLERQVHDRTLDLKNKNELLKEANEAAELAVRAKSRVLAAVGHDLRQPMHALTLFFHALKRRVHGSEETLIIGKLEQSLNSLTKMLDGLLHIARLDAGLIEGSFTLIPVRDLIERIGAEFSLIADQRRLRFNYMSVECFVRTDPVLLETIVRNLLSNAMKFTRSGGVLLGARSRGSNVVIEIYDTGVGISEQQLSKIFIEFERTRLDANGPNEGLGLGLSIVERNAKIINARITVQSTPGRGSRFSIEIPKHDQPAAIEKPRHVTRGSSLSRLKILVLDDNPEAREALVADLHDRGAVPTSFSHPRDAILAVLSGETIDVAVIDYDLGDGLTGLDFMRDAAQKTRKFPALMLTGRTDTHTLHTIAESGVPWMGKPADPDALAAAISRLAHVREPLN